MGEQIETYLSNVDWEEKIISEGVEQNSKSWLLTDIANYLKQEYDVPSFSPNKPNVTKAKELMDGIQVENSKLRKHPPVVADKSERERKLIFKKIVKDAQEKGYIQNFQLSEPWHPKLFMEGELNTFPYQHNSMITFRGVSRDHFYLGGDNPEDKGRNTKKRHSDSVLNLGHWNPGNTYNEDNEDAVWTTFRRTAEAYARRKTDGKRGVLLKMQVPTKWVQCGAHDVREVHGLKEIIDEFGSPQNYREHVKNTTRDENCAWLIRPKVPLHFIKRVWDLEILDRGGMDDLGLFDRPVHKGDPKNGLPLQSKNQIDAIDLMHVFQEQKMPDKPNFGDAEDHQEAKAIVEIKQLVSENARMKEISHSLIDNIQTLKTGYRIKGMTGGYETRALKFDEKTEEIIGDLGGPNEGLNESIQNLAEAAERAGLKVNVTKKEVDNLKELQKSLGRLLRVSKNIEDRTDGIIVNLISNGRQGSELSQTLENLFLIAPSGNFSSNVQDSKEKIENEFRLMEDKIDRVIQTVNFIYQLEVRLAEVVKITETVQNQGYMTQQQFTDLHSAIRSYEDRGDKRYGVKDLIRRGRKKLKISNVKDAPEKENFKSLEKGCMKRLQFIQQKKDKIEEIEKRLKKMRNEVDRVKSSPAQMSKTRLQEKLEELKKEYEQIISENGELYHFFSNFRSIDFEYGKFESKVKN